MVDFHVRTAGAGDDGLRLFLTVLGLALDQRDRLLIVAGLGMGSVGPGHSFFRHKITSLIVYPRKKKICGRVLLPSVPRVILFVKTI